MKLQQLESLYDSITPWESKTEMVLGIRWDSPDMRGKLKAVSQFEVDGWIALTSQLTNKYCQRKRGMKITFNRALPR